MPSEDIPRQLSARHLDASYDREWSTRNLIVSLDGQVVPEVVRYDMDAGWLEVREIVGEERMRTLVRREGVVTVELPE